MKTMKADVKNDIREMVEGYVRSSIPDEAKVALLHIWIVGLVENADTHANAFFEDPAADQAGRVTT
jgi:hypothetical protein